MTSPLLPLSLFLRGPGTWWGNNWYLRVKAPGAPYSVTGLASWYMGSGFSVGGAVIFFRLTSVSSPTSPP